MYALGAQRSDQHRAQGQVLMPTPRTTDMNGPGSHGNGGPDLRTVVSLLPTPAAGNPNDGEDTDGWLTRRAAVKARLGNGNGMGMPLAIAVALLPTPQVADVTGGHKTRSGSRSGELLLPGVAEYLSGISTSPRSGGGNTSPDGWPLPPPFQLDETETRD
jgi:hypothetical protein